LEPQQSYKFKYLIFNLLKGILWLSIIVLIFFLFKTYFNESYQDLMSRISNKPFLVISVFVTSEVLFGIIPPELFMIWALHQGAQQHYFVYVFFLALLSYFAGMLGYYFGFQFSKSDLYQKFKDRMGSRLEKNVQRFGGFMIFIAAITPIPYSAICMIAGAARFNFVHFLMIGISRFARFLVYGYIIWQVDQL